MIIKVSEDYDSITDEIKTLKKLRKSQKSLYGENMRKYIPQCFNFGMIVVSNFTYTGENSQGTMSKTSKDTSIESKEDSRLLGYFIMRRYEQNLETYVCNHEHLSVSLLLEIHLQLVNSFQIISHAGLVFNDLKLQNIMINENKNSDEGSEIVLIDYGFATSYLCKDKKTHIS